MLTLIYIIGFLLMTAKTSHDTGRDYPKTVFGFPEIFVALGSGVAWPLWLLTVIPFNHARRKAERLVSQEYERSKLEAEGRSEVERLLAPAKPAPVRHEASERNPITPRRAGAGHAEICECPQCKPHLYNNPYSKLWSE